MKTIRSTDIMGDLWVFRHPLNGSISVIMRAGSVPIDRDGYAEWEDILKLLSDMTDRRTSSSA